jgi:hypothetical protein
MLVNSNNIFDTILTGYGTLEQAWRFLSDNSTTINTPTVPGTDVIINPAFVVPIQNAAPVVSTPSAPSNTYTFKGTYGQNVFDIALNTYGSVDNLVKLLGDNGIDLSANLMRNFVFDSTLINDLNIYNTTTKAGYVYSTGKPQIPEGDFNDDFSDDFSGG